MCVHYPDYIPEGRVGEGRGWGGEGRGGRAQLKGGEKVGGEAGCHTWYTVYTYIPVMR